MHEAPELTSSRQLKRGNSPSDVAPVIDWRSSAYQSLKQASAIVGLSVASLYKLARDGRLPLKRLGGRTLIETRELLKLIDAAEDWAPSPRADKARASRAARRAK